jgi:hypothetical protein
MRTRLPFALLAALSSLLATAPAHARARVFVASYGNDTYPCSFGSPCRTFQQAVNVVDAGGEVTAIDSAGFGPITINKAVTITSPNGVEAGIVPVSGGNSITINAGPSDTITLSGLVIDGAGTGANGVSFAAGGALVMEDCVIRNMTGDGIHFVSNVISSLSVANTFVSNNRGNGILVQPVGSASVTAAFERVRTQYNGLNSFGSGISLDVDATAGTVSGTATDTVSSNNYTGFTAEGILASLTVVRSVAANNNTGVQGTGQSPGARGFVYFGESTITNNVSAACNGQAESFRDNYIIGNGNNSCLGSVSKN